MDGFGYQSPADEEQRAGRAPVLLGVVTGALFIGLPIYLFSLASLLV